MTADASAVASRRIDLSVEVCNAAGEVQVTVEDPAHPDPEFAYQDMVLHPATCHLLHELLCAYLSQGVSTERSHVLNLSEST